MSKKYYNIREVSEMLDLPAHRLRYMDKSLGSNLTKIRGRRYYTLGDIDLIKKITNRDRVGSLAQGLNSIDSILISLKRMKLALEGVS